MLKLPDHMKAPVNMIQRLLYEKLFYYLSIVVNNTHKQRLAGCP